MGQLNRVLAAAALSVVSAVAAADGTAVKIQDYPGIVGTLARVAIEKGYCSEQGLDCSIQMIPAAPLGIQTMLAGGIDVALTPPEPLTQALAKGADLKIVAGAGTATPFMLIVGQGLFPVADKGYPAIMQDLKGKKIGVTSRGAAPEFQFKTMLAEAGMQPDDVTFVAVGAANTAYPSLLNKQVDAVMGFTPLDGFCEVLKTCRIAVSIYKGEGPKTLTALNGAGSFYVARESSISKNPKAYDALAAALKRAGEFASDPANAKELLDITLKYYKIGMPEGDAILANALERFRFNLVVDVDPRALQNSADYLRATGQISQEVDTAAVLQSKK